MVWGFSLTTGGSSYAMREGRQEIIYELEVDLNYETKLVGTLPDFSRCTILTKLSMSGKDGNKLTGKLPEFRSLPCLRELDLARNQLSGHIPSLEACTDLRVLTLCENQFTGPLPKFSSLALERVTLHNNQLSGTLHEFHASAPSSLEVLSLSKNQLTGTVPDLSDKKYLNELALDHNNLDGNVPTRPTRSSCAAAHDASIHSRVVQHPCPPATLHVHELFHGRR